MGTNNVELQRKPLDKGSGLSDPHLLNIQSNASPRCHTEEPNQLSTRSEDEATILHAPSHLHAGPSINLVEPLRLFVGVLFVGIVKPQHRQARTFGI